MNALRWGALASNVAAFIYCFYVMEKLRPIHPRFYRRVKGLAILLAAWMLFYVAAMA